jgi:hypothetical protein
MGAPLSPPARARHEAAVTPAHRAMPAVAAVTPAHRAMPAVAAATAFAAGRAMPLEQAVADALEEAEQVTPE